MFTPSGPTFRDLVKQALSSVERGYDLLAPNFDHTPFRTSERMLAAVAEALEPLGPFDAGLDVCCGTGAGIGVLRRMCRGRVTGVDFSAGMLAVARDSHRSAAEPPVLAFVRADALALPFAPVHDLAVSFGAFGHFLPRQRPALFAQVRSALRPGGRFAFPVTAPPRVGSRDYWLLWAFDAVMRLRNAVWRPQFVMYYRTFRLADVMADLRQVGFTVELRPLPALGRSPGGAPRALLVVATR